MVLLLSPMDRALTFSLTAKRAALHLTNPYCKSNWWVVVGDLSGLPDPQVLLGLLDPPASLERRVPRAPEVPLDLPGRADPRGPQGQQVQLAQRVPLVPLARRASKAQPALRGQLEPKG